MNDFFRVFILHTVQNISALPLVNIIIHHVNNCDDGNPMKTFIIQTLIFLAGFLMPLHAAVRDSVQIYFRTSHTELDPDFRSNRQVLDRIFNHLSGDSSVWQLQRVSVRGGASPEGSVEFNRYLSEKRAQTIFSAFEQRGFFTDSTAAEYEFIGRDWAGLRRLAAADSAVPYQADVLALLDQIIEADNAPATPVSALKALHRGVPYMYMYKTLFPQLRESSLVVEYDDLFPILKRTDIVPLAHIDTEIDVPAPELTITAPVYAKRCRPFYMGLKTNLIYDAMALPNIGAEFYIGKNWTLTADWLYGWWDRDPSHRYWRAYGGWLGARKWFGSRADEKPLTGHHMGAFAGVITYDFEFGGTGIMGGLPGRTLWDRCNVICGIEYGYSLPIARRLNLDFSIALGYIGGKYYKYEPRDGWYEWQSTHRLNWFGPTKAEISLVWLIGCDNYNR